MLGNTKYSFWWTPKPVTGRRSTRAQKGTPTEPYRNVMYDKRVVRGSNYGATSIELETYNKAAEWRRRNLLRKKVLTRNQRNVIGTPPPVMGRRHEVIQTDKYLEELLDHPPVRSTDTQTDLFLEPPPTPPPFVASKIGIDVGTSIEPGDLLAQQQTSKIETEEYPLIERFIEACITETAKEVELEIVESNVITKIENISELVILEKLKPQNTETTNLEILTTPQFCYLNDQVDKEVVQIVDSHEILTVIIEEIIKQEILESDKESGTEEEATNDAS